MIRAPRRRRISILACAVLAGAAAIAAPRPAHAAAPSFGSTTVSYIIPTREAEIYLEVVHPTLNGKIVPAPVILTYTPYAVLGRNGDASHWTALGYARATADVIGTGNSGGCWDYGGPREISTAHQVVEWIAGQSWTTGKIGMLGGSYEGTTQYAAAVTHPKGLVTIVPEAAIDRWYDYAYAGGIRYTYTNQPLGYEGRGRRATRASTPRWRSTSGSRCRRRSTTAIPTGRRGWRRRSAPATCSPTPPTATA